MRRAFLAVAAATAVLAAATAAAGGEHDDDVVLRVNGRTAVVLVRATRTVYRYELPAAAPVLLARRLAARPAVVVGPETLVDPVSVAIDSAGTIYVADAVAGGGTVVAVAAAPTASSAPAGRPPAPAAVKRLPIPFPPSAIEAGARLIVADAGSHRIVSLDPETGRLVIEREDGRADGAGRAGGAGAGIVDTLLGSGGTIWAFDAGRGRLLRLFETPRRSPLDLSSRTLRGGEAVAFREPLPAGAGAVAVAGDVIYTIDRGTHRLAARALSDAAPVSIDYRAFVREPQAIAADTETLYFVDAALRLVRMPRPVPATAYFEAGTPSENAIAFYQYLADRRLLPLDAHVLRKGDAIATLVTATNLLPGAYPDAAFEALFCRLNATFCQGGKVPPRYYPGQRVRLPAVAPLRYVARRAVTLPVDAAKFPALATRPGVTSVADLSAFYAPLTAADAESLRAVLGTLNYTYAGADLLAETRGRFVVPVDAVRVAALVPAREVADPRSALNQLRSRNLTITAAAARVEPETLDIQPADDPPLAPAVPDRDPRCEPYDPKTYRRPQALISYCVPVASSGPVHVAIVDNLFDPTHREFAEGRLRMFAPGHAAVERTPLSDAFSADFDPAIDHGTHVAAIVAARNASNEIAGVHPRVVLNAVAPVNVKDLLDAVTSLNICSISLGAKRGALPGAGLAPELKTLAALVQDPAYQNVLFVIAAGNEGQPVGKGMFAELGAQDNVIVVGAAAWADGGPLLASYSNRGAPFVSIVAPGNLVRSATFGGGYGVASGTSQATAFVAGTAALLRSGAGATWAPWQLKERLLSTADLWLHGRNDRDAVFSGMLNMKRALFDTGAGVFTRENDPKHPITGHIAAEDREHLLTIAPARRGDPAVFLRLGDIRRFVRNEDGTRTIVYSVTSGGGSRHLERLLDVSADRIRWSGTATTFTVERLDGSSALIDLADLRELVNEVW